MKLAFIINSKSRNVDRLVSEIKNHQHALINNSGIHMTEYRGHACDLAKEIASRVDIIISVGGDGTLHEVVNGLMYSGLEAEKRPSLGLIPMGSANDFARIQKVSRDLDRMIKSIEAGRFEKIDIGRIRILSDNSLHYFINVADSGIGAEVVQRLEESSFLKMILSSDLRFATAIFQTFFSYNRKKVEIIIDNEIPISGKILTLVVANSSSFASGLIIAPDARINDGKFQILVGDISLWGYLMSIGRLKKGEKLTLNGVRYLDAKRVSISSSENLFTEADGELVGSGDVEIDCIPGEIKFLFP